MCWGEEDLLKRGRLPIQSISFGCSNGSVVCWAYQTRYQWIGHESLHVGDMGRCKADCTIKFPLQSGASRAGVSKPHEPF